MRRLAFRYIYQPARRVTGVSMATFTRLIAVALSVASLLSAGSAVAEVLPRNGYVCISAYVTAEEEPGTTTTEQVQLFAISVFDAWARANGTTRLNRPHGRSARVLPFPTVDCDRPGDLFVNIGLVSDDGRGSDFVRLTISGTRTSYEAAVHSSEASANGSSAGSIPQTSCQAGIAQCLADDPTSGWRAATEDVIRRFTATLKISER